MTRIGRVGRGRRRPDMESPTHERARVRAAERLDGPLDAEEAAWLDEHLASCEPCRVVARAYEADRSALRAMRADAPVPPRDLWARTAAAIDREAGRRPAADPRRSPAAAATAGGAVVAPSRRRRTPALGVLSGIAVVAVVIGASALSGGFLGSPSTTGVGSGPSASLVADASGPLPGPTPIVVGAGDVGWVGAAGDGRYAYNVAAVDEVCARGQQPDCAPVRDGHSKTVAISARPRAIIQSPVRNQAVVVGTDIAGADAVLVIALPTAEPTARPSESPTTPTTEPSTGPSGSGSPSASPTAGSSGSSQPTASPTESPASEPPASPTPTPPTGTAAPTAAAALAIASGVTVLGQSAAYSGDGTWFAFTARPSDGSAGPDIWVWHVGDAKAHPLTDDHLSVFASWFEGRILGSRPASAGADAGEVAAQSFFLDPKTGDEAAIAGSLWRPVVDPAGHWVVAFEGTVKVGKDGYTATPAGGRIAIRRFVADVGPDLTDSDPTIVADKASSESDVHWDETGQWLAIWMADPAGGSFGRLSLARVDPATGHLDRPTGAPEDVAALAGFSIGDGRLAWATPPGQGGEGSRVQIVAWTKDAVGSVESAPGKDVVIIH